MKHTTINAIIIGIFVTLICLLDFFVTSLYWQHQAVIHHSAFFEASSWGNVSFHWNDVSFAQTPLVNK
jgi:hypothetical protein